MNNKQTIFAVVVLVSALLAGSYLSQKNNIPASYSRARKVVLSSQTSLPEQTDFSETGNILKIKSESSKESSAWKFLYQKSGMPVLQLKLIIDANSVCIVENQQKPCVQITIPEGQNAQVEGKRLGEEVTVSKIIFISQNQNTNNAYLYCEEQKGRIQEVKDKNGQSTQWCILQSGKQCEAEKFYNSKICN